MIDREIHLYHVNLDNQLQFTPEIQLNIKSLFKNFKFLLNKHFSGFTATNQLKKNC